VTCNKGSNWLPTFAEGQPGITEFLTNGEQGHKNTKYIALITGNSEEAKKKQRRK
jgi:hypothetical protein